MRRSQRGDCHSGRKEEEGRMNEEYWRRGMNEGRGREEE
jgi:hypothetical protein